MAGSLQRPRSKRAYAWRTPRCRWRDWKTLPTTTCARLIDCSRRRTTNNFLFRSPRNGEELIASFARFSGSLGRPWEAIVITPTDDFIGELKATNRQIFIIITALSIAELFLIC